MQKKRPGLDPDSLPPVRHEDLMALGGALRDLLATVATGDQQPVPLENAARGLCDQLRRVWQVASRTRRGLIPAFTFGFVPPMLSCNNAMLGAAIEEQGLVSEVGRWFHERGISGLIMGAAVSEAELIGVLRWLHHTAADKVQEAVLSGHIPVRLPSIRLTALSTPQSGPAQAPTVDAALLASLEQDEDDVTELGLPAGKGGAGPSYPIRDPVPQRPADLKATGEADGVVDSDDSETEIVIDDDEEEEEEEEGPDRSPASPGALPTETHDRDATAPPPTKPSPPPDGDLGADHDHFDARQRDAGLGDDFWGDSGRSEPNPAPPSGAKDATDPPEPAASPLDADALPVLGSARLDGLNEEDAFPLFGSGEVDEALFSLGGISPVDAAGTSFEFLPVDLQLPGSGSIDDSGEVEWSKDLGFTEIPIGGEGGLPATPDEEDGVGDPKVSAAPKSKLGATPGVGSNAAVMAYAAGRDSDFLSHEALLAYILRSAAPEHGHPDEILSQLLQRLLQDTERLTPIIEALIQQAMAPPGEAEIKPVLAALEALVPDLFRGDQRSQAIRAIAAIGQLAAPNRPSYLRDAAQGSLKRLSTAKLTRWLMTRLTAQNRRDRREARMVLQLLGGHVVALLCAELKRSRDPQLRVRLVEVLSDVGRQARVRKEDPGRFLQPLIKELLDGDSAWHITRDYALVLANVGSQSFEKHFIALLRTNPEPRLLPAIALGLRHASSEAAMDALEGLLYGGRIREARPYGAGIPYLYRHNPQRSLTQIRDLLRKKSPPPAIREACLHGLAVAGAAELPTLLREILTDRKGVRRKPAWPDESRLAAVEVAGVCDHKDRREELLAAGALDPSDVCQARARALQSTPLNAAAEGAQARLGFRVLRRGSA